MEWIPVSEQPLPKDGRNIMVTISSNRAIFVDVIYWDDAECKWLYVYDEAIKDVSRRVLMLITAWMYYPAPYKG